MIRRRLIPLALVVTVLLAVGTQRDCMCFAGGKFVAGKKYLATNDPPPAACP